MAIQHRVNGFEMMRVQTTSQKVGVYRSIDRGVTEE